MKQPMKDERYGYLVAYTDDVERAKGANSAQLNLHHSSFIVNTQINSSHLSVETHP